MPMLGDNALLKMAPLLERLRAQPPYDLTDEPRALLGALGVDVDGDAARAVLDVSEHDPAMALLVQAMLGVTVTPTRIKASDKINVIPARAELMVDCRVPPGLDEDHVLERIHELLGADGYGLEFTEKVVGNRSPMTSPLMDAHRGVDRPQRPRRRRHPHPAPGLHRLAPLPRRLPRVRRLRVLPHAPHGPVRDVAADARAPTSASTCATSSSPPRSSATSRGRCSVAEPERLRLGGMALRNGLLVHGPTHWAAAVRCADGGVRVASGPKPRVQAFDAVPGARGVARLSEAMAVIPLVKRALPEARLPFQDKRVVAGALAAGLAGVGARAAARRAGRASLGEAAAAGLSLAPSLLALAAASSPPTTASSTRRSRPTSTAPPTRPTPPRSTTAAARTSWRRMLAANLAGAALLRRLSSGRARWPPARWAWCRSRPRSRSSPGPSATPSTRTARALRRPGFELQRAIGTREPDERQLEVGRAALAEILRAEGVAA